MGHDRHSKSTDRFDEDELQRLTSSTRGGTEIRPTSKIHKDELLELIERASRAADPDANRYAAGSMPIPVARGSLSPEVTDEPSEMQHSGMPESSNAASSSIHASLPIQSSDAVWSPVELAPDLAEAARRRKAPPTAPLTMTEIADVASAAHRIDSALASGVLRAPAKPGLAIATGEIAPIVTGARNEIVPVERVPRQTPAIEAARDYWILAALAAAIIAFTLMIALIALA